MSIFMVLDPTVVSGVAVLISLMALVTTTFLAARQKRLLRKYRMLLRLPSGTDLEQLLLHQNTILERLQDDLAIIRNELGILQQATRGHIQKTAIIRFSAFPETGSDLSFAIALLDADNNGVVLSSLYGRNESRIYAKPIQNGTSTYQLSAEEKQAIAAAMGQSTTG